MKDEIFGPILPIIAIESLAEAIQFINKRPKPLALYLFSSNEKSQQEVLHQTSSGALSINDALMHFTIGSMPFGGVGESGMGGYGGKFSFETFTHKKSVLNKSTKVDPKLRYPPYTKASIAWLQTFSAPSLGGILSTFVNHYGE
jgi:aldehyde dehydrogenase (NAD+)